jgi:hypothetical protein
MSSSLLQHVRRDAPCPLLGGLSRENAEEILLGQKSLPGIAIPDEHFTDYWRCVCPVCVPFLRGALECIACGIALDKPSDELCAVCELYVEDEGLCGHCWGLLRDGHCTRQPRDE